MKSVLLLFLFLLFGSIAFAQTQPSEPPLISPDGKTLDAAYFKPKSLFYKLSWLDKDGKITREAVLNNVAAIDEAQKRLTYRQIRNDGKEDVSIAELPTLKPIHVSSVSKRQKIIYDYGGGQDLKIYIENEGKVDFDGNFKMPRQYFDGFLSEYLLGALPLKPGFTGQFDIYHGGKKKDATLVIKKVIKDVLPTNDGKFIPVYLVFVQSDTSEIVYSIDAQSREMLKSAVSLPDGSMFVKTKI